MHELETAIYIVETVGKVAAENKLTSFNSVTVQLKEVSVIIPEYLLDFWKYARRRSEQLKETELKVEPIKATSFCESCMKTFPTLKYG